MKRIIDVFSTIILPIIGTIVTAINISQDRLMRVSGLIIGIICITIPIIIIVVDIVKKRKPRFVSVPFIAGVILLFFSIKGNRDYDRQQQRNLIWEQYMSAQKDNNKDTLQLMADANDGPAQYELSTLYFKKGDYLNARLYAQKAADNGNPYGYVRLSQMYQYGLGCKEDHHQAVNNMIKAMHLDYIVFGNIIKGEMSLTESDSLALEDCIQDATLHRNIIEKIVDAYKQGNNTTINKTINQYYDELVMLSKKGFIPATEALYVLEIQKNPNGSDESKRLAKLLYQVNRIPTGPMERFYFYNRIDPSRINSTCDVKNIQDNLYLSLHPLVAESLLQIPLDQYSNEGLISEYQILRAQYHWCKELDENDNKRIDFFIHVINDYHADYLNTKNLLKRNIQGIQERMNHLDEYDDKERLFSGLEIVEWGVGAKPQ